MAGAVGDLDAIEVVTGDIADVREQGALVFVEVQEGAGAAIEDAALLLDQAGQGAELGQQIVQAIQIVGSDVSHGFGCS